MLAPVRTVAPAATPVSVAEAKTQLGITGSGQDTLVGALIDAATQRLDGRAGILGRALVNQTWEQAFGCFSTPLRLPLAPVSSITEITYFDGDNATQTLSADVYRLLADARGPYVARKPDQDWPGTYAREDAVTVTFVAGYGAAGSNVPAPIRQAIILMVRELYEFAQQDSRLVREQVPGVGMVEYAQSAAQSPLPRAAAALLAPYRRVGF